MSTASRPRSARHKATHPAGYRETGEQSILRSDDSPQAISLTVAHGRHVTYELRRADTIILAGDWDWHFTLAGTPVETANHCKWKRVCSEVNDSADYIELQLALDDRTIIERQVFLARKDRFVFLADVVKTPPGSPSIMNSRGYRMSLSLAEGIQWCPQAETHEGFLCRGRGRVAQVFPLSLPEWRAAGKGSLESTAGDLVLSLPLDGQRLQAALFIDLEPRRLRRTVTWRRLTVAESLAAVGNDIAVGYRVQIGKSQWLVYRSLGPRGNRTVLGQNFSTEFVVARFPPSGLAEKLLEIE